MFQLVCSKYFNAMDYLMINIVVALSGERTGMDALGSWGVGRFIPVQWTQIDGSLILENKKCDQISLF